MKKTKLIMGMPITIEVSDKKVKDDDLAKVFDYFRLVDHKFSPFKKESEVFLINSGSKKRSRQMREILSIAIKTKKESNGFFDVWNLGKFDPSGIVKSWAIKNASEILKKKGFKSFYVNAGGDIQTFGKKWRVGIKNPFNKSQIVKALALQNYAIATSGTYEKGNHIYSPIDGNNKFDIVSLTVVAKDILEADRFATAAFAMGRAGINFLEEQKNLEAYMIDIAGNAVMTSGLEKFVIHEA